jgi:SAM-dependent methyltransferase
MHINSMVLMKDFIEKYNIKGTVLDIGSLDINGTYRELVPGLGYIGVDLVPGKNVDMIMDSEQWLNLKDVDAVISGQTLEHVADIPKLMKSIFDVLKDDGLLCIIVPSQGMKHNYPDWYGNFTAERLSSVVSESGFEVLECTVSDVEPWHDIRCIAWKKNLKVSNR